VKKHILGVTGENLHAPRGSVTTAKRGGIVITIAVVQRRRPQVVLSGGTEKR